ncbi:MAG: anthranilate/aminodeoxychorismate synthase component II [Proteobacteria bacterium]|nr:MAG: anthranilate/aminodeoxychorismate synthase component II [Pseudomonadota bacterium]
MIDNYDSFTFNLVQYLQELGAEVETVRNDALTAEQAIAHGADAIVISPGPCTPNEAGVSVELVRAASGRVPLLGVCLGHQSIAQAFGGSVVRTGRVMHGKTSPIHHQDTDVFAGLPNPFEATRYHSLMADPRDLPGVLQVTAWSDDPGGRVIMGLAHRDHPTWGVQFHPESILTIAGKQLLANFLHLARAFGPRTHEAS